MVKIVEIYLALLVLSTLRSVLDIEMEEFYNKHWRFYTFFMAVFFCVVFCVVLGRFVNSLCGH